MNSVTADLDMRIIRLLADVFRKNQTITTVQLGQNNFLSGSSEKIKLLSGALIENKTITKVSFIERDFGSFLLSLKREDRTEIKKIVKELILKKKNQMIINC